MQRLLKIEGLSEGQIKRQRLLCQVLGASELKNPSTPRAIDQGCIYMCDYDALSWALLKGNHLITELLLNAGAHLSINKYGYSRFFWIANTPHVGQVCFIRYDDEKLPQARADVSHLFCCFKNYPIRLPKDIQRMIIAHAIPLEVGRILVAQYINGKSTWLSFKKPMLEALYENTITEIKEELAIARATAKKLNRQLNLTVEEVEPKFGKQIRENIEQRLNQPKLLVNNMLQLE